MQMVADNNEELLVVVGLVAKWGKPIDEPKIRYPAGSLVIYKAVVKEQ